MELDHIEFANATEEAAYEAIREAHGKLVVAGALLETMAYADRILEPLNGALRRIEDMLDIVRREV